MSNVIHLQHAGPVTPAGPESIEAAVREVSARIAGCIDERRRLHSRLDELRSADPAVRRRRRRTPPIEPLRPVTFFSIEEAAPDESRGLRRA